MKTLMLLAAICLVLCVVLPQNDAYCIRYRSTSCGLTYISGCGWYRICVAYYNTNCYTKRDEIENDKATNKKGPGKAILEDMPCKFSTYDKNDDGSITFDEFRSTLADVHGIKQIMKAFRGSDTNGDGVIKCNEFKKSEWGCSHKHVC
ncbi:uncharacterized protein LOC116294294 [Actinia tenebrosa]|uniref:Uncharacterized protein LOC116294294 n=1 Tax=Actinia tenebrosa TaxID=6105 RepID=A0A6P8HQ64_ACTTE|nr:uncharacterized protein LOC116294294 [Actinia tenebrosa]